MTGRLEKLKHTILAVYRAIRWPAGLLYIAMWVAALSSLGDGSAVATHDGCTLAELSIVQFWRCTPDSGAVWLAAATNFISLFTVQAPMVLIAGLANPVLLLAAITLLLGHVVGLPSAAFVLRRMLLAGLSLLRRGQ